MHKELRYAIEPNLDKDNFKWEDVVSLAEKHDDSLWQLGKRRNTDIRELRKRKPLQQHISNPIIKIRRTDTYRKSKENNTHPGKETHSYTRNERTAKPVTSAGNLDT